MYLLGNDEGYVGPMHLRKLIRGDALLDCQNMLVRDPLSLVEDLSPTIFAGGFDTDYRKKCSRIQPRRGEPV